MPARHNEKWDREEHILAFNLYCKIPFGQIHHENSSVMALARLLDRSPGSIAFKLSNFARLDPALQARGIRGLSHGAKGEETIWEEFASSPESLAYESERLLATRLGKSVEDITDIDVRDLPPMGIEREAIVRVRVNQSFFRRRITSTYDYRCCVTGLAVPELLVASHIVPWAQDASNRLNPRNGLCLNSLHDRAFDRGLMWVDDGFIVRFADKLRGNTEGVNNGAEWLISFEGTRLRLPGRFSPDPALLRMHKARCMV